MSTVLPFTEEIVREALEAISQGSDPPGYFNVDEIMGFMLHMRAKHKDGLETITTGEIMAETGMTEESVKRAYLALQMAFKQIGDVLRGLEDKY